MNIDHLSYIVKVTDMVLGTMGLPSKHDLARYLDGPKECKCCRHLTEPGEDYCPPCIDAGEDEE